MSFVTADVRDALSGILRIDLFFYREDSFCEGGNGLYLLGKRYLSQILAKFPGQGGLMIKDGSNTGNDLFRNSGYSHVNWDYLVRQASSQPYFESDDLYVLDVLPKNLTQANRKLDFPPSAILS